MRKSFTQLFGFLLLSVMMLFTSGLRAQEAQSTVELYATAVDQCYNVTNSYTSKVSVRDFIKMESFSLTLNFDKTKFTFDAVANANPLLLTPVTATVIADPVKGIVRFTWTNPTPVTIGDNVVGGSSLFDVKFKVLDNPVATAFNTALTWDVPNSLFFYDQNFTAGTSYQVETTNFFNGTLNVPVNYTAIQYTTTAATCAGGQANITITSPVGTGLLYFFNGNTTGTTSPVATAQAPSVNTVRVQDANGCTSHLFSIAVSAPDPLVFTSATTENPLCFNDNGEITFNISGGTAPYTYWVVPNAAYAQLLADLNTSGGVTTLPVFTPFKYTTFQVLKPGGDYMVAVNDGNGCLDLRNAANWKAVTITPITSPITFSVAATNNTCNGSTDGTIAVTAVAGGTPGISGYTVSIDGIHWFNVDSETNSYTFSGLTAKVYTVSVKDSNGCTVTLPATVTQPSAIVFTTSYTDASCSGGSTGTISIKTVSGGTGPYTFAVALVGQAAGAYVSTAGAIGGLAANYYSVWVKDANGCIKAYVNPDGSGNILPIQAPGALSFTTNADNADAIEVTCNPGDFTLSVTALGGTAPYTYSFDGGTTYSSTKTLALTALVIDTPVSVYVKDANGCITNKIVTINVPVVLAIDSFTNTLPPTCSLGTDGRTTVNVSGGVAPYSYSTDNVTWFTNKVLALPEGTTTVYVKDAKGCTINKAITIDPLTVSAFAAAPTGLIACNGNSTTQGIAITGLTWIGGRTIQYFVSTSSSNVFTSGTVFVPASVNGVAAAGVYKFFGAGTYYVGARDQYGCTATIKTVVFLQNPALQLSSVVTTPATCSGLLNGSITINTLGGNGTPFYALVNNPQAIANLQASDFQAVESYNGITKVGKQVIQAGKGLYYVVLRDVCVTDNSIFSDVQTVDGYLPIGLDEVAHPLVKTNITCHDTNDGTITVTGVTGGKPAFDGTGLYTYKLYKNGVLVVTATPNTSGMFTGLSAGDYYVTITDATNCPLKMTSTVTVNNPATVTITNAAVTHFTCATSNDGVVALTVAGGTGSYMLAVNASVNGLGTDIKTSDWIAFPTATPTFKNYIATDPGDYTFYVKDANGCLAAPYKVTVLAPKVITPVVAVNTPVSCAGGNDGSVDINATGGFETTTPAFTHTYLFSLKADFSAPNTDGIFSGLVAGTYTVYVKATNTPAAVGIYTYPAIACTYSLTFNVAQPLVYSYSAAVVKHVACKGSNDGELDVTVVSGGTPFIVATLPEYDVQLTTTANPDLLPGNWTRTTGKVAKFINLPHAIYSVWIRDAKGCVLPKGTETFPADGIFHFVASWEVQEPGTALDASAAWNNDVTCFGGNDGKYTVTATGGVAPYTYAAKISILPLHVFAPDPSSSEWQTSNVFDKATVGTWIIWVKDANGCIVGGEGAGVPVDAWRVAIRQPQKVDFTLANTEPKCFGDANGTITASNLVSDAGAPYSITVSGTDAAGNAVNITRTALAANAVVAINIPASVTRHIEPTPPHATEPSFNVTVTDKNGCSNMHTMVVWQNTAVTAKIVKADGAFVCPGDNNGVIEAVAGGGTGSYTYRLWKDGVIFTSWVAIPSFLVEVGHTWKVEVMDANGCTAVDEVILNAPVGVTATLKETTCFSDLSASVVITATGEVGRSFAVRYRLNTDAAFNAFVSFASSITINNLVFANSTPTENFYYFEVKDDKGCTTTFTKSFVPTQHPLEVTPVLSGADLLSASITITGGISPYSYQIGTGDVVALPADGNTFQVVELKAPQTTVTVKDAHGCFVTLPFVVAPLAVTAVPVAGSNMTNKFDVVLTFNRNVTIPAGGLTVTGGTSVVTGSGKVYTVAITAIDAAAVSVVLANTITDVAGNALVAKTFTYTVGDHVAPMLVVTPPATPVATLFTVGLKFSEAVTGVLDNVTVTGGQLVSIKSVLNTGGTEYTLTASAAEQTAVTIVISDAITDISTNLNKFAGQTLTYTTGDFTNPELVTMSPSAGITIADNWPTFKMTFTENVMLGAGGSLRVYKVNTTDLAIPAIPITAGMISGKDVTVTYAVTQNGLNKDTRYYVLVDGTALTDMSGNAFIGVGDVAAWTFKTGPVFATGVSLVNGSLFKVYPNPFVSFVNVDNASMLSKVVVTNIAGQVVKEVVNPTMTIQLNELRSGIYFMSLYNKDNVITQTAKIVKR